MLSFTDLPKLNRADIKALLSSPPYSYDQYHLKRLSETIPLFAAQVVSHAITRADIEHLKAISPPWPKSAPILKTLEATLTRLRHDLEAKENGVVLLTMRGLSLCWDTESDAALLVDAKRGAAWEIYAPTKRIIKPMFPHRVTHSTTLRNHSP